MFVAAIQEGLYTLITIGLISIIISMYYYIIVVKKMYINEPIDPSPIAVPGALKAVIYIGLAGTFILGVYPQWFMNQVVLATSIFSGLGPTPIVSHFPFGGSSPHFH